MRKCYICSKYLDENMEIITYGYDALYICANCIGEIKQYIDAMVEKKTLKK